MPPLQLVNGGSSASESSAAKSPTPPGVAGSGGNGDDGDMRERVATLEAILPTLATKADIADLRGDFKQGLIDAHRWVIATAIGLMVGFGGLFLAMSNTLKGSVATASEARGTLSAQPPVTINLGTPSATQVAPSASAPR